MAGAIPTHFPYIAGAAYAPGPQPFSPGNSHMPWDSYRFTPIPWPKIVPTLSTLASFGGQPRERAGQPFINQFGVLPANYLTLGGVVEKSKG